MSPTKCDKAASERCMMVALSRVEYPEGMDKARRTRLMNSVVSFDHSDINSSGPLTKFVKKLSRTTGMTVAKLSKFCGLTLRNLERGTHYTFGRGGSIKPDGTTRAVILTPLGKNQLYSAGAQHGEQNSIDFVDQQYMCQQYMQRLILAMQDNAASINQNFQEKNGIREESKKVYHESIQHVAQNAGISIRQAQGSVRADQKKFYQACMPKTKGSFTAATVRANGNDPEDAKELKKVARMSVASNLTRSGAINELWLRDRALNLLKREPHLSWKECADTVRDHAIRTEACLHLNKGGKSNVSPEVQEKSMLNHEFDMYGPTETAPATPALPAP